MKIFKYRTTPIALIGWIICLWFLHNEVKSQSFLTRDAYIDINDGALIMRQDYMGYYLGNTKIGYSRFILKEESKESETKTPGKYYLFQSDSFIQIQALGLPMTLKTRQEGEVNDDLSLRSFSFSYEASGQRLTVIATVEPDGIHLNTRSNGDSSESVIPHAGPIYHTDLIHLVVAKNGLEIGKQQAYPVFEPMTMSYTKVNVKVLDKENLKMPDGEVVDAYKLELYLKGLKTTSWINKDGDVFKEVSTVVGITSTAVREPKEQATDMSFVSKAVENQPKPEIDLIKASKIPVSPPLQNPDRIRRMDIELLHVKKDDVVIDGTLQTLLDENNERITLRIQQPDYSVLDSQAAQESSPFPVTENLKIYTQEQPLIQSENDAIRSKALEITQNDSNRWKAAQSIARWLYQNIEKEMRVTIPSAIEVLSTMKGDCNEHSTLFAALARSIGIPTKICAGLVYQDDGFYYHAWNEVYLNGQWIPIDATLNRIEMDATHIKLAEGSLDSQSDIVNLIGEIDVKIISVDYRS